MGLINFIKEAGAYLFGAGAGTAVAGTQAKPVTTDILKQQVGVLGVPVEGLNVAFTDPVATVRRHRRVAKRQGEGCLGDRQHARRRQGGRPALGETATPAGPQTTFYTVQKGDTLSAIAKAQYGNASKYPVIFEANKPMLKDPDKTLPRPGSAHPAAALSAASGRVVQSTRNADTAVGAALRRRRRSFDVHAVDTPDSYWLSRMLDSGKAGSLDQRLRRHQTANAGTARGSSRSAGAVKTPSEPTVAAGAFRRPRPSCAAAKQPAGFSSSPARFSPPSGTPMSSPARPSFPKRACCCKEEPMSLLAWIVLGIIAGFIGSKIVNKTGEGLIRDLVLGVVGAIVGGWLFAFVGQAGVTGLNLYSLLVAVVGAIVVLLAYHAIRRIT